MFFALLRCMWETIVSGCSLELEKLVIEEIEEDVSKFSITSRLFLAKAIRQECPEKFDKFVSIADKAKDLKCNSLSKTIDYILAK